MSDPRKQPGKLYYPKISKRKLSTILAALHHWRLCAQVGAVNAKDFPEYFKEKDPLSAVETVALIDELNYD